MLKGLGSGSGSGSGLGLGRLCRATTGYPGRLGCTASGHAFWRRASAAQALGTALGVSACQSRERMPKAPISPPLSTPPPTAQNGERWLKEHPEASKVLLDSLGDIVIEYLSAQAKAGAQMLQVRSRARARARARVRVRVRVGGRADTPGLLRGDGSRPDPGPTPDH